MRLVAGWVLWYKRSTERPEIARLKNWVKKPKLGFGETASVCASNTAEEGTAKEWRTHNRGHGNRGRGRRAECSGKMWVEEEWRQVKTVFCCRWWLRNWTWQEWVWITCGGKCCEDLQVWAWWSCKGVSGSEILGESRSLPFGWSICSLGPG